MCDSDSGGSDFGGGSSSSSDWGSSSSSSSSSSSFDYTPSSAPEPTYTPSTPAPEPVQNFEPPTRSFESFRTADPEPEPVPVSELNVDTPDTYSRFEDEDRAEEAARNAEAVEADDATRKAEDSAYREDEAEAWAAAYLLDATLELLEDEDEEEYRIRTGRRYYGKKKFGKGRKNRQNSNLSPSRTTSSYSSTATSTASSTPSFPSEEVDAPVESEPNVMGWVIGGVAAVGFVLLVASFM